MSRCLNLTKAGEYAVSALARLAVWSRGEDDLRLMPVGRLAREQNLPVPFLSKLVARCGKAGLVRSGKGRAGGVALARAAEDISLLEIIEVFEGDYRREACVFFRARPCAGPACEVFCPLREQEESLRGGLAGVTLADMAQALARHPDARSASGSGWPSVARF